MPYVRPDVQAVLDQMAASGAPPLNELPLAEARMGYKAMGGVLDVPRGDLAEVKELSIPGPAGAIPARLYRAGGSVDTRVLVYFHGGGWVIGDLDTHDPLCAEIARATGLTVVAVDYRLAPEHVFPAAAEDCIAAARWVAGSPAELGRQVSGILVAGDSAGGNLSAAVAQALAGKLPVPLLLQWLIYPALDAVEGHGSMTEFAEGYLLTKAAMDWFYGAYTPDAAMRADVRASPLRAASLEGQPPALIMTCGLDPLRDEGRAYAGRLAAAGVPVRFREAKGQIHGCFTVRAAVPSAQEDLAGCIRDLKAMLAEAA